MRAGSVVAHLIMATFAASAAVGLPRANEVGPDSDEAVVYPASVDQSWIDAEAHKRSAADADEAVVYPAGVDQSWIDAETST